MLKIAKGFAGVVVSAALTMFGSGALADTITFTGNGGSSNFGNSVGFTSDLGGITGSVTATDSSGNTSGVSGFTLDGYGVAAGGYRSIQGDETLIIDFDQAVDIGSIHLRQWEGPDDGIVTTFYHAGGSTSITHTSDSGGAFNTNEHIGLNVVGVTSVEVEGIYNGKIFGIPKTQFFVAGFDNVEVSAVPLPAAAWLFGSALMGLLAVGRRRAQQA